MIGMVPDLQNAFLQDVVHSTRIRHNSQNDTSEQCPVALKQGLHGQWILHLNGTHQFLIKRLRVMAGDIAG